MSRLRSLLPRDWLAIELPGYRNHPQAVRYSSFDYEGLPPIERVLDADFAWLTSERIVDGSLAEERIEDQESLIDPLTNMIIESGLSLPAAFTTFLRSVPLQQRVRSSTSCYLLMPDFVAETEGREKGFLVHFLCDPQWFLRWYLYVAANGDHFVLVSTDAFGFEEETAYYEPYGTVLFERPAALNLEEENVFLCADSFSEFMYRFWIENEIWYALAFDRQPLTPEQQRYVDHYGRRMPSEADLSG